MKEQNSRRIEYENSMVAVCDILGFKTILYSQPLENIVKFGFGYLRNALYHCLHHENPPEHDPTLEDLQTQDRVGFAWFSDTILLYSLEDNEDGYQKLIETSSWVINHTIVRPDVRFRIGVSYGKVFIDPENRIYLGKAIAEAYELQSRQEWSGGALTPKTEAKIPHYTKEENFPHPWHLVRYRVPLKATKRDGITAVDEDNKPIHDKLITVRYPMLAIDWTRFLHSSFKMDWSKEKAEPSAEDAPFDVIIKWKNIVEFRDEVCMFCKEHYSEIS